MSDIEKREIFKRILLELSRSQDTLQLDEERENMYMRLEELYCSAGAIGHFRHFYSDIFEVLAAVKKDVRLGTIEILGQNIKILYEKYEAKPSKYDISKELRKLNDHVSLEIARISYSDAEDYKISNDKAVKVLQDKVMELTREAEQVSQAQKQVEREISSQQREYITILGIFAAVVLAFTASINYSSSLLSNIEKASIYRLIIVSLVIGLVLINILFGLFYYIDRLVNTSRPSGIRPMNCTNVVILALIILTLLAWSSGTVESRNERVKNNITGTGKSVFQTQ